MERIKAAIVGHRSVIRGLISANELTMADCDTLSSAVGKVEEAELDEDELKDEIQTLALEITADENRQDNYRAVIKALSSMPVTTPFLSLIINYQFKIVKLSVTISLKERQKAKFETKLETLYELESATSDLYTACTALYETAQEGINALGKSWTGSGFNLATGSGWQLAMDKSWHDTLPKVIDRELAVAGWDKEAINAYKKELQKRTKGLTGQALSDEMDKLYEELLSVGAPLYQVLFESSKLSHEDKVKLVLSQMGAVVDQGGLQLTGKYKFDKEMDPTSDFLKEFTHNVQKAFPGKKLSEYGEFGREVHLFKGYIDKQNINYLKSHYPNEKNDFERLLAYANEFGIELDYSTGASLHNRSFEGQFDYTKNMKILLPNTGKKGLRMAEFIFDLDSGSFVSQWDVYEKYKLPDGRYDFNKIPESQDMSDFGSLANTESFNYGPSKGENKGENGVPNNQKGFHNRLDVKRPNDTDMRQSILDEWQSPKDFDEGGQYIDIVSKGREDYDQWQKIPKHERRKVYDAFLVHCRDIDNVDFASYCKEKKLYQ